MTYLDTHICLNCHATVIGLDNYVTHKKAECPARKTFGSKLHSTALIPCGTTNGINIEVSSDVNALPTSTLSPSVSGAMDPNMILGGSTVNSHIPVSSVSDFFSSLELQSRPAALEPARVTLDGTKDVDTYGNVSLGQSSEALGVPKAACLYNDDILDHQKAMKIASILNDLEFNSDSEGLIPSDADDLLDFSEDIAGVNDAAYTPSNLNTNKWRPVNKPDAIMKLKVSGGKWKPGMAPSTGGKWRPGERPSFGGGKTDSNINHKDSEFDVVESQNARKARPGRGGKLEAYLKQREIDSDDFVSDNDAEDTLWKPSTRGGKWKPLGSPVSGDRKLEALGKQKTRDQSNSDSCRTGLVICGDGVGSGIETNTTRSPEKSDIHLTAKKPDGDSQGLSLECFSEDSNSSERIIGDGKSESSDVLHGSVLLTSKLSSAPKDGKRKTLKDGRIVKGRFSCEPCGREFCNLYTYRHHCKTKLHGRRSAKHAQNNADTEEKVVDARPPVDIECPVCSKSFHNKYNFVRHLVTSYHKKRARDNGSATVMLDDVHQLLLLRQSAFQCEVCHFYCDTHDDLLHHMRRADHFAAVGQLTGPLQCMRCHFRSRSNDDMIDHFVSPDHIETVKNSSRPCTLHESRYRVKCSQCERMFNSATRLQIHMKIHHDNGTSQHALGRKTRSMKKRLKCQYCGKELVSASVLAVHIRRHHTKERPFSCGHCKVSFVDNYTLRQHNHSKHHLDVCVKLGNTTTKDGSTGNGDGRTPKKHTANKCKCDYCEFTTYEYRQLRPHYLEVHADRMYSCSVCGKSFQQQNRYNNHLLSVQHLKRVEESKSNKAMTCSICNLKFYNANQLKLHNMKHTNVLSEKTLVESLGDNMASIDPKYHTFMSTLPKGRRKVKCPDCGVVLSRTNLLPHLRNHTGTLPFKCMYCDHCYSSATVLRRHLKAHLGIHDYKCDICGKLFQRKLYLNMHKLRKHKEAGDSKCLYTCDVCTKSFFTKNQLSLHMRLHSGKTFRCDYAGCRMAFHDNANLKYHKRMHTNERPYLCDECGYAGKSQQQLTRHRRTHTGERNFHCEYCTYKAINSSHLRRHMRVHIGTKPFKCPYCDYRCNTLENLRKHILKTKVHAGLPIYPCKLCEFGASTAREIQRHLVLEHGINESELMSSSISVYTGLYERQADVRRVPEGCQVIPLKEKLPPTARANRMLKFSRSYTPRGTKTKTSVRGVRKDHTYIGQPEVTTAEEVKTLLMKTTAGEAAILDSTVDVSEVTIHTESVCPLTVDPVVTSPKT